MDYTLEELLDLLGRQDEHKASLDGFLSAADIELRSWEYDAWRYNYGFDYDSFPADNAELTGLTLYKFVLRQWGEYLSRPKVYAKDGQSWRKGSKRRVSRIMVEETDCPYTGVCFDEDFLSPIRQLIKTGKYNGDYKDLIEDCLNGGFKSFVSDFEYQQSNGYIDEFFINNEYEFTEDGRIA